MITRYDGYLINWELGPCTNAQEYDDYSHYIQRCCLKPGHYTLSCYNTEKPDGWKNGYLELQNRQFCHDFMSFKAMQRVQVKGMF